MPPLGSAELRAIGEGHSNSSVVLGEQVVLKVYRRLAAGNNPELELLRFLTGHGFANAPQLLGSYEHSGRQIDATLGIVTGFVPAECDGWTFALASLAGDPSRFLDRLGRLGEVTGSMRAARVDSSDPAFAPRSRARSRSGWSRQRSTRRSRRSSRTCRERGAGADRGPRGRGARALRVLSRTTDRGRVIRHHGNFHLGDLLGPIRLDRARLRGPPDRSLAERRRKLSPLRDVASMLRSLAYAEAATVLMGGTPPPGNWEEQARERFLSGYFAVVEPSGLVPGGAAAAGQLLTIFELEKAVDELRHELARRPDWVPIPVAAIERLLAQPSGE
jgi:trehalose synthase-fused probable maltokinase